MTYGKESKSALVKLIGGKRTTIHVYGQDQFDLYVGDVYCNGVFIQVKQAQIHAFDQFNCFSSDEIDCVCMCLGPSGENAEEWSRMAFYDL